MEDKEMPKAPPKTPEGELEKALAKIAELEARLRTVEQQLNDERVRNDYLKNCRP